MFAGKYDFNTGDLDEVYLAVHQKSLTAAKTKTSSMADIQMFSRTTS